MMIEKNGSIELRDISIAEDLPSEMKEVAAGMVRVKHLYRSALKVAVTQMEILDEEFAGLYDHSPIHHIEHRIKTLDSTVKKLKEKIAARDYESEEEKQAALGKIGKRPFVFALRDEDGNVYKSYAYLEYSKTVYQYIKVSFSVPGLTAGGSAMPSLMYPSPDAPDAVYIYKGEGSGEISKEAVESLSFEMYYEDEAYTEDGLMGKSIVIYKATKKISPIDCKKELDGGVPDGLKYINEK